MQEGVLGKRRRRCKISVETGAEIKWSGSILKTVVTCRLTQKEIDRENVPVDGLFYATMYNK